MAAVRDRGLGDEPRPLRGFADPDSRGEPNAAGRPPVVRGPGSSRPDEVTSLTVPAEAVAFVVLDGLGDGSSVC